MKKFGQKVVKYRVLIFVISLLLLIPSAFGFITTRINYDILSYLPQDMETMKGQDILLDEFGTGAFSLCVVEGMDEKDISAMRKDMEKVDHVKSVIWYDSIAGLTVPMDVLPNDIQEFFNNKDADSTLMIVLYDSSMSSDETMDAVKELRKVTSKDCYISGMSAVVTDIKDLVMHEIPIYVIIAAILSLIILQLTMDSAAAPLFFLLGIGMAIVYNLGTNFIQGEMSYLTEALTAVLQLAVTMDYSIFLWHSYEAQCEKTPDDHKEAMANAIGDTLASVTGSSITTIAGFIALCFMTFTLGLDLGVVMAKGVVFGVIGCVTILPSMLLIFDKFVQKTRHKPIIPDVGKIGKTVIKKRAICIIIFLILLVPAAFGYKNNKVYYDLVGSLPKTLPSITANTKMDEQYAMGATHIAMVDSSLSQADANKMINQMKDLDGVKTVLGVDSILSPSIPRDIIPKNLSEDLINDKYELLLISSEYAVASDEVNEQCTKLEKIIKSYDKHGMLIGEAPCTKDLIETTDTDFKVVNALSIAMVFVIILFVFKSISLPFILVAVIEAAICMNMGISYYTGTTLPFIASIVIGTIQLGATVDYAILMTTKYKNGRYSGLGKKEAITKALTESMQSIIVSALSFFAATFGVGMYSNIDMISSLCNLMARGAIISMIVVIFVLPSLFMIFDKLIIKTSKGFINKELVSNK